MHKVDMAREKFGAFREKILEGCPPSFDLKCVVDGDELRLEYTYSYDWLVQHGMLRAKIDLFGNLASSLKGYGWECVHTRNRNLDNPR